MIHRFVELGNGYSDLYELFELANRMPERIEHYLAIHSVEEERTVTSLALVMKKTSQGEFQPIYICLEGLPYPPAKPSKRFHQFEQLAASHKQEIIQLTVKSSAAFHEKPLFFQYLISILKMNRLLRPYY